MDVEKSSESSVTSASVTRASMPSVAVTNVYNDARTNL